MVVPDKLVSGCVERLSYPFSNVASRVRLTTRHYGNTSLDTKWAHAPRAHAEHESDPVERQAKARLTEQPTFGRDTTNRVKADLIVAFPESGSEWG